MEPEAGKQSMNSVKKNFIYNIVYQLLIMVIPLITAPYLARVIGSAGVGTYSYTYSIVYYFMMITMLGVNNYGNRSIAKARNDRHQLSKTFWGIYLFQLALGILMLVLYLGFTFFFEVKYTKIALIQSLFIISAILDINWFYFGLEKFKITITRNAVLKILSVILIFGFVRHSDDLWKYTLIMSGTTVLSQFVLWTVIRKEIELVKISLHDITQHIKSNLVLFIPVIAVSLYKMMDKIMLGYLVNVTEVGYYENAEKIMNIPQTFIAALGTVMLPQNVQYGIERKPKRNEPLYRKIHRFYYVYVFWYVFCSDSCGISFCTVVFWCGIPENRNSAYDACSNSAFRFFCKCNPYPVFDSGGKRQRICYFRSAGSSGEFCNQSHADSGNGKHRRMCRNNSGRSFCYGISDFCSAKRAGYPILP